MAEEKTEMRLAGEPLSLEGLLKIPIFQGAPTPLLEKNLSGVVLRRYRKNEVICSEGEYGSTAFYILKGRVKVFIKTPFSHVRTASQERSKFGIRGLISKMASFLARPEEDPRSEDRIRFIPIDAPVDLSYENPTATLKEGDLFGEMTCLSRYPRSATVVAEEDCEILEMLQNILQICQRNPQFKKQLDDLYRKNALANHLKSIPLFSSLSDDFLQGLKNKVELMSYEPGTTIFSEGDTADAFYFVRLGFVKVTKAFPGGEMVLSYLPRAAFFGEIGLLEWPHGKRNATCSAIDHVELVCIKAEEFNRMIREFPDVAAKIRQTAESRQTMNRYLMNVPRDTPLKEFLDQGMIEAQNLLILDLNKCTRCDACTQACAATHDGVTRLIREGLRYDHYLVATSCRQCTDPLCMIGCPVGSIRRKDSLEIVIEDWCIGCGLCAKNCPYGNINMHPFEVKEEDTESPGAVKAAVKKKAMTCDLCTELKEPACVYACPHDAAHRVNPREFFGFEQKTNADRPNS